jgi:peptidyl-prolyl cis-trans isomerase B (cyclophilin B)
VATNQMRREAAQRKLERQQERRAQQAKRRRKIAVFTSVAVVVIVLVGVVALSTVGGSDEPAAPQAAPTPTAAPGTCAFTATGEPAAKPVAVPDIPQAPTEGQVAVSVWTNRGEIPLTLDRAKAPCTVASFVHLAQADFYDQTPCHRLTTGASLSVLQCGDPTGSGSGGPGYQFPDETSPDLTYPRGTVAMANAGPNTNGSQFFLVYADSQLPPNYTVFGTIDEPGLAVLDQIAAGGLTDERQPGDGAPAQPVTITDVAVAG